MQEITVKKLSQALRMVANFERGEDSLEQLVNALDGIVSSMEERLPQEFLLIWEDVSFNLESIYALGKEIELKSEIRKELDSLETLISNILTTPKGDVKN